MLQHGSSIVTKGSQQKIFPWQNLQFIHALQNPVRPIEGTDLSFCILSTEDELDQAFKKRYQVFCEEQRIAPVENYPDKKETDDYDSNSIHTAVLRGDEILAYTRLVLPCEQFPMERTNFLPEDRFERSRSVEVSRALTDQLVRKDRNQILLSKDLIWHLFNGIYCICQEAEVDAILSFSTAVMNNGYRKRGVPMRYVGEQVLYHGHPSFQ